MERRKFIALALGGATTGYLGWRLAGGGNPALLSSAGSGLARFSRRSSVLGTEASMTVYHHDPAVAEAALDAAFAAIDRVEQAMSLYRADSDLCRLNSTGSIERPDPQLVEVLRSAAALARRTGGAFDPTVQPLWELYRDCHAKGTAPDAGAIERACKRVDWRRIAIADDRIQLRGAGTRITLNGIAQGCAADAAAKALADAGVTCALVDCGEIGSLGRPAHKPAWKIGIKHPRRPGDLLASADLRGRCLATSGDYATTFSDDFRDHHLFDPRTGRSAAELSSVSVAAATAMEADALSTAVFVLGLDAGLDLVRETPGADALIITRDGQAVHTPGFAHQTRQPA